MQQGPSNNYSQLARSVNAQMSQQLALQRMRPTVQQSLVVRPHGRSGTYKDPRMIPSEKMTRDQKNEEKKFVKKVFGVTIVYGLAATVAIPLAAQI